MIITGISSSNILVLIVAGNYSPKLLLVVDFDFSQMKQTDIGAPKKKSK